MRPLKYIVAELRAEWRSLSPWGKAREVTNLLLLAVFVFAVLQITGCASIEEYTGAAPYFEVGLGHQLDDNSDWYVRTEREYQCSNPQGHFELGMDAGTWRVGYHHQSWLFCGNPVNGKPELYQDDLRITYRFGGK